MTEGKIVSWVKSEGDKLAKGESVVVVESDKADMDVESFYDGFLATIIVPEGSSAPVGSPIALLAESEDEIAIAQSQAPSPAAAAGGDAKPASAPAVEDVSAATVVSSSASTAPSAVIEAPAKVGSAVHPASEGGKRVVASPYAKKLAKDLGVDLRGLSGSGPSGRIVAKDVETAASAASASTAVSGAAATGKPSAPAVELGKTVPFTTMQNAVSRNMVESLTVPTFRVGYTITTDALDALYKKVTLLHCFIN